MAITKKSIAGSLTIAKTPTRKVGVVDSQATSLTTAKNLRVARSVAARSIGTAKSLNTAKVAI